MTVKEKAELTIGRSPLTGTVFVGMAKDMGDGRAEWKYKKNVTALFDAIMIGKLVELKDFDFVCDGKDYHCTITEA